MENTRCGECGLLSPPVEVIRKLMREKHKVLMDFAKNSTDATAKEHLKTLTSRYELPDHVYDDLLERAGEWSQAWGLWEVTDNICLMHGNRGERSDKIDRQNETMKRRLDPIKGSKGEKTRQRFKVI